jgi:hypothetical protein
VGQHKNIFKYSTVPIQSCTHVNLNNEISYCAVDSIDPIVMIPNQHIQKLSPVAATPRASMEASWQVSKPYIIHLDSHQTQVAIPKKG